MKYIYPIVISEHDVKDKNGYQLVTLPDFDQMTQGKSLTESIEMGQDLLAILATQYEDDKTPFPPVSSMADLREKYPEATVTLVVADTNLYRQLYDNRAVKKTLSIPAWLNTKAERAGVNFSQTLQEALKQKLG